MILQLTYQRYRQSEASDSDSESHVTHVYEGQDLDKYDSSNSFMSVLFYSVLKLMFSSDRYIRTATIRPFRLLLLPKLVLVKSSTSMRIVKTARHIRAFMVLDICVPRLRTLFLIRESPEQVLPHPPSPIPLQSDRVTVMQPELEPEPTPVKAKRSGRQKGKQRARNSRAAAKTLSQATAPPATPVTPTISIKLEPGISTPSSSTNVFSTNVALSASTPGTLASPAAITTVKSEPSHDASLDTSSSRGLYLIHLSYMKTNVLYQVATLYYPQ